jgi:hypothetical protein
MAGQPADALLALKAAADTARVGQVSRIDRAVLAQQSTFGR